MTTSPIRVGIAGLGRSGWDIHAKLLQPMGDRYRIVAVTDADATRRLEAVERFDCLAYANFNDLINDKAVELVVVSLPSFLHADCAITALDAGKHVVCEKPMAASLADADRMVAAAAKPGAPVLSIFQNRRYNPDFRKVQEIIASGVLGRTVQIRMTESRFSRRWDWQTLKKFGGGSLNNTGPHFLDIILQLFGPAQPEVFVHLDRTLSLGDADDHVKLVLKAEGAPTIDLEISSCDAYPDETWHILGTQGGLHGSPRRLEWKFFNPAELIPRELDTQPTPDRSYNRDSIPWQEASWDRTEETDDAYRGFYRDLYATIRNGAPLAITPESVRRVIWLQEECHRLGGM